MKLSLVLVLGLTVVACGKKAEDKEAVCTNVCAKIQKEDLAKCSDDACKKTVNETFDACQSLCKTVANTKPGKTMAEQGDEAEQKCAKGDNDACALIGGAYLLGKGGKTKDETKGINLLTKSCDAGAPLGCELLGRAYDQGKGVSPDPAKAVTYWTKSCDAGGGAACRSLALKKETSDPSRIPLLEKACDKNDGLGCMGLGAAYLHGNQGAEKDLEKAKQFMKKSCDLGQQSSCEKLKDIQ